MNGTHQSNSSERLISRGKWEVIYFCGRLSRSVSSSMEFLTESFWTERLWSVMHSKYLSSWNICHRLSLFIEQSLTATDCHHWFIAESADEVQPIHPKISSLKVLKFPQISCSWGSLFLVDQNLSLSQLLQLVSQSLWLTSCEPTIEIEQIFSNIEGRKFFKI